MKKAKKKLVEDRGSKCEICGITEWCGKSITFDEHHCDRDRTNSEEKNKKLLCPNCHRQQHLRKSEKTKKAMTKAKKGKKTGKGRKWTEEQKQAARKPKSASHRENIRLAKLGEKNPMSRAKCLNNLGENI